MRKLLAVAFISGSAFACSLSDAAGPQLPATPAVFSSSTEQVKGKSQRVPVSLLKKVLRQEDENSLEILQACITGSDERKPQDLDNWSDSQFRLAQNYFILQLIYSQSEQNYWYLLRPALEPYCGAFYGAHIFHYWLLMPINAVYPKLPGTVEKWKILRKSAADALAVYRVSDKEWLMSETGCSASQCKSTWYRLGANYQLPRFCSENGAFTKGERIVNC